MRLHLCDLMPANSVAVVCISFGGYGLSAICIINTENELIFTTCPCVYIELCSSGVQPVVFVMHAWICDWNIHVRFSRTFASSPYI